MERHSLDWFLSFTIAKGECLEWTRCFNTDGYPRVAFKGNVNGKVHRIVYELSTGINPLGKVIRHKCDNIRCINPDHLEIGDNIDNVMDRCSRGRTFKQVESEEVDKVTYLRTVGKTYKCIAEELNIKIKRVEYICNKYLK